MASIDGSFGLLTTTNALIKVTVEIVGATLAQRRFLRDVAGTVSASAMTRESKPPRGKIRHLSLDKSV